MNSGEEGRRVFGLRFEPIDAASCADKLLRAKIGSLTKVALFITPNIQHVAEARRSPEVDEAFRYADLVVADGFPVFRYVRAVGPLLPERVTGREVTARILNARDTLSAHRLYFVLDSEKTLAALRSWAAENLTNVTWQAKVSPPGFSGDYPFQQRLVEEISEFGPSLLFLCVGTPRSELFVSRHRNELPPCWALSVGQSVRVVVGLAPTPPRLIELLNLEWLWRIGLEPRRMLRRYVSSAFGFLVAVVADVRAHN